MKTKTMTTLIITIGLTIMLLAICGCASFTTANYPLRPNISNKSLQRASGVVVYYKQTKELPKEVLLVVGKDGKPINTLAVWEDIAKGAVEGAVSVIPAVDKEQVGLRKETGVSNIEVFTSGADTPEKLAGVSQIIATITGQGVPVK